MTAPGLSRLVGELRASVTAGCAVGHDTMVLSLSELATLLSAAEEHIENEATITSVAVALGDSGPIGDMGEAVRRLRAESATLRARVAELEAALSVAEAALADIGDADREEGDGLAWCERRAAAELPGIRAVLKAGRDAG